VLLNLDGKREKVKPCCTTVRSSRVQIQKKYTFKECSTAVQFSPVPYYNSPILLLILDLIFRRVCVFSCACVCVCASYSVLFSVCFSALNEVNIDIDFHGQPTLPFLLISPWPSFYPQPLKLM